MPHSPRWKKLGLRVLMCAGVAGLALPGKPKTASVAVAPFFNGVFPPDAPGAAAVWVSVNAFPGLGFTDPMWIAEIPGTDEFVVVEKSGKLKRFRNDPEVKAVSVVLDLGPQLQVSEDQGLYQIAFHPEFGKPGSVHAADVFLTYSHRPAAVGAAPDKSMWRLSRFQWQAAAGRIDPASESVLIQQYDPNRWHNGGAMAFDNSGCLMVTCGDGGGTDDQFGQSQALDGGFFGGVFRIDMDNDLSRSHAIRRQPTELPGKPSGFPASFSQGYSVPNDNPWLDPAGGLLEETYAIGLRSPHSAHYDRESGGLWVGDVGRKDREEFDLVTKAANLQWPFMEGSITGPKARGPLHGVETPPVYEYNRAAGGCIIGGMRYRGTRWADRLGGKVIFGDNVKGSILALEEAPTEGPPFAKEILSGFGAGIYSGLANICTDSAGEIYLMKLNGRGEDGGTVQKMVPGLPYADPPALLSATGLFLDTARLLPSPALVPFEVASPGWSDGAGKQRWIVLPNDGNRDRVEEKISYSAAGNWSFPAGTVFVKHLEMPLDERRPGVLKRFETRVMVCTANGGKYGLTYRWNEQGSDAVLLAGGEEESFTLTRGDGSSESRVWSYPSRGDCLQCHTNSAGQALGLRTHQINRMVPHAGGTANQLARFNSEGMFEPALGEADLANALEARPLDDDTAPLEHRVRSYLDANCAHCHQPGGMVPYFDARLQTALQDQGLIDAAIKGQYQLAGGRYLKPDNARLSAMHVRLKSDLPGIAMPPLGRHSADQRAVDLLAEYIGALGPVVEAGTGDGELVAARAVRCSIAAPREITAGEFEVTIVFDAAVSGFESADLEVSGGQVKSLRGRGYYYVAMVAAEREEVEISLPPDRVQARDHGNLASSRLRISTSGSGPSVGTEVSMAGSQGTPGERMPKAVFK
ncbi:PQQ-dependent sugar dehydrogenase [Luteolibacter sp. Populi]|uniref:PQQ-dependent sugar dehydrogenase n=1 Tax=Luteolibacter sp. Populi TaxID=3230487 RepID=UPI003467421A